MIGQIDDGIHCYTEAIRLSEATGGTTNLAGCYHMLALVHRGKGQPATSRQLLVRAREIAERQGDVLGLIVNAVERGALEFYAGHWDRARAEYEWAEHTSRHLELTRSLFSVLLYQGELPMARGDLDAASTCLAEAAGMPRGRSLRVAPHEHALRKR
jgi:hypothetical protein